MTKLVVTQRAQGDLAQTIDYLERVAGKVIAERHADAVEEKIGHLLHWPESAQRRPELGDGFRSLVVSSTLLIHVYDHSHDTLTIVRMIDGRRDVLKEIRPSPKP